MTASESAAGPSFDAPARLQASRSTIKSAMAPARPAARTGPSLAGLPEPSSVSMVDTLIDGVDHWWQKSTVGRAAKLIGPVADPYLKPLVRRHYQALLLTSAAAGALVSLAPWRSARVVFKIARPLLFSGVLLEVAKAGYRQATGKPRRPRAAVDTVPPATT